jgi:hypothetical protein
LYQEDFTREGGVNFKIFIQARKDLPKQEPPGETERMFSYDVSAEGSEQAVIMARQRFTLEHGLEGWTIVGVGSVEMP